MQSLHFENAPGTYSICRREYDVTATGAQFSTSQGGFTSHLTSQPAKENKDDKPKEQTGSSGGTKPKS